jgi:hypothetical protein
MPISTNAGSLQNSANRPAYVTSFVYCCHSLMQSGYKQLNAAAFAAASEEEITGELVKAIQGVLENFQAPEWMKHFWAQEEERVNDTTRRGKHRLRIDILFLRHQAGERPRFRLEAKRLTNKTSRNAYLGSGGLACFLDGRYGANDQIAGMLGYVQKDTIAIHVKELRQILAGNPGQYFVAANGSWAPDQVVTGLETHRSIHTRPNALSDITILHSFLLFT